MPSTNSSGDEIDIYTYEGSPNVKVIYGYSGIVAAFAFFVVIDNVIKKVGYPKSVKTSDIRVWRNLVKSWIHALVVSGTLVYCYFTRFDQLTADPLYYCDYTTYLLVSFSQGYYSFDTFDNLQHFTISEKWEVHVHHFVILVNLLYILQYRVLLPYTLYSVIPEINTVFLHFRKLLQLHGWPRDHIIYRSVVMENTDDGFKCSDCGKTFIKASNIKRHCRLFHRSFNKKWKCTYCDAVFNRKDNQRRHEKVAHLNIKKHACTICESVFGTKLSLQGHMRRKHDSLKLICNKCNKCFIFSHNFKIHQSVCGQESVGDRVSCQICRKTFKNNKVLKGHKKDVHLNVPESPSASLMCEICGEYFTRNFSLKRHLKRKHQN